MKLRKIVTSDLEKLMEISKATFWQTFAPHNTVENMNEYMSRGFSQEKLVTELDNKNSEFYFSEIENDVVGYMKINFSDAQTEFQDEEALEVERIYVLEDYKGIGMGTSMLDKAMEIAYDKQKKYIFLGVWEHNYKAIRFYEKNGFVAFDKHNFMMGDDNQTDILMKKEILHSL